MRYDQNTDCVPQFVEMFIHNAIESEVKCHRKLIRSLLLNTLNIVNDDGLKLSHNCLQKLYNFVCNQPRHIILNQSDEEFNDSILLWKLTFELFDSKTIFKHVEDFTNFYSPSFLRDFYRDNAHDSFVEGRLYTILLMLLDLAKNHQNRKEILNEVGYGLYVLISHGIRCGAKLSLAHALSSLQTLSDVLLRNGKTVIQSILSDIDELIHKNDEFSETYIVAISFIIDSSIENESMHVYFNTDHFWAMLRKCLDQAPSLQKYVFHVLKYVIFNSGQEWINEEMKTWWKTYFLILETFNEAQTHIILPVFPIIEELIGGIDLFSIVSYSFVYPWIVALLRKGTEHDSRTVRMWTIFYVLDAKMDDIIFERLIESLNDAELFRKIIVSNEFDNLTKKLTNWFDLKSQRNNVEDQYALFMFITSVKWSPIQLYYILVLGTRLRFKFQPFNETNLKKMEKLIHNATHFHSVVIRSAIQSLLIKLVIVHSRCNANILSSFFVFLDCFNMDECLIRNGQEWCSIVSWLQYIDVRGAETFVISEIHRFVERDERISENEISSICRNLLMLHDALDIFNQSVPIRNYTKKTITSFRYTITNPYLFSKIQDNRLRFVCGVYELIKKWQEITDNLLDVDYVLHNYIFRRLFTENDLELVDWLISCMSILDNFRPYYLQDSWMTSMLSTVHDVTGEYMRTRGYWKMISYVYESMAYDATAMIQNSFKYVNVLVSKSINEMIFAKKLENEKGIWPNDLTNTFWKLLETFLTINRAKMPQFMELSVIFAIVFEALDITRDENLPSIFACLRTFFSLEGVLKNEEKIECVVISCWKRLRDARTTQYYTNCVEFWAKAFLQKSFLESSTYRELITACVRNLLDDAAKDGGPAYAYIELILNELENIEHIFDIYEELPNLLVDIFCLTHINRKDQTIEWQTVEHISCLNEKISVNQVEKYICQNSTSVIRLKALNIILRIHNTNEKRIFCLTKFVKILTKAENSRCKRYFNDSILHRMKHKKLQLLLIFETIVFCKISRVNALLLADTIYGYVVNSLLIEPHQPSVRYLLEWILIRLVIHFPAPFESQFWNSFSQASEERIGSVCSFISVAFHLCKIFDKSEITNRAIKSILPWAMGQHFNARLYAQTVLSKMLTLNSKFKTTYEIIENSLACYLKRGNAIKNAVKLQEDFYFNIFHPEQHFSLKTILWDLPRLSSISNEEWISSDLIQKYVHLVESISVPLTNPLEDLSAVKSSSWIAKCVQKESYNYKNHETKVSSNSSFDGQNIDKMANVSLNDIQKKFIPMENLSSKVRQSTNLIVVASLIERAPNLGGLTRTSEIFGALALIMDNLDIIHNKDFMSLSITAEKHVPLIEVKRHDLFEYLKKLKEEKYCIVAAEQTSNSVNLNSYKFPSKCVIVLGNEKEGIPASLLPIIDVCVEVPQKGVIRSLNVHVTGSLLIWEYTKQQF